MHGKIAALLAAFCLILFCTHTSYPLQKSPFEMARNEADGVTRFAQSLQDYDADLQALKKKPRATAGEVAGVERKANAVRTGISDYRRNLNGFISRLKGAGKWTSELDSYFEEMAAKSGYSPAFISQIKGAGGARSALEGALAQAGGLTTAIDQDLKEIKGLGPRASWFHVDLIPEAHAIINTIICGVLRTKVIVCTIVCCCPPCCGGGTTCPPCCL